MAKDSKAPPKKGKKKKAAGKLRQILMRHRNQPADEVRPFRKADLRRRSCISGMRRAPETRQLLYAFLAREAHRLVTDACLNAHMNRLSMIKASAVSRAADAASVPTQVLVPDQQKKSRKRKKKEPAPVPASA